jgi:hypothetical protein
MTDEIDERVKEAAESAKGHAYGEIAVPPPAADEAPLELDAPPPPAPSEKEDDRRTKWNPLYVKMLVKRSLVVVVIVAVVGLGAGAFFLFTKTGRDVLPEDMKTPAAKAAIEIEQRAREATGPTFYTFTDDKGVIQIVDDVEKVPAKYRAKAKISH